MSKIDQSTLTRLLGNSLQQEVESQQRMDATVARIIGSSQTVADSYRTTPQTGHGPGRYTPQAKATNKDTVALFVPQSAFDGTWQGFQQARDKAIDWLRSHKYAVEDAQKLCWGPAFGLDPEPLSYRDSSGKTWFNASIEDEPTYQLARIHARA
ncbi:hypothetical protein [uncultured Flavonifractor sp.]|uniref:hypothetical protein n=1 Tax=uncultured Flavonifractor sp. TaxID=1193534 RepID=UPI00260E7B34|nr:hypothetical protein [uncultured Flavonifractor sp.]